MLGVNKESFWISHYFIFLPLLAVWKVVWQLHEQYQHLFPPSCLYNGVSQASNYWNDLFSLYHLQTTIHLYVIAEFTHFSYVCWTWSCLEFSWTKVIHKFEYLTICFCDMHTLLIFNHLFSWHLFLCPVNNTQIFYHLFVLIYKSTVV